MLLAEDNRINDEVAVTLLTKAGLRVDVVHDGLEAVSMDARRIYALILMDMQMPLLDGPAAADRIRAVEDTARTPIVATTASAYVEDLDRCMAADMNDFIAKPVDPPRLYATIERWLGPMARPSANARRPPVSAEPANGLRALAGLDVARGRAFFGGDDVIYRRGWGSSAKCTHWELGDDTANAPAVNIARAKRLRSDLHAFASDSAAVGALALFRLATGLERDFRASGDDAPSTVDRPNADLREFVAAVQVRLRAEAVIRTASAPRPDPARP